MGFRDLSVLGLVSLILVILTTAANVGGGNGGLTPAEETEEKEVETEAPADTITEKYDINALVARLRNTKAIAQSWRSKIRLTT